MYKKWQLFDQFGIVVQHHILQVQILISRVGRLAVAVVEEELILGHLLIDEQIDLVLQMLLVQDITANAKRELLTGRAIVVDERKSERNANLSLACSS